LAFPNEISQRRKRKKKPLSLFSDPFPGVASGVHMADTHRRNNVEVMADIPWDIGGGGGDDDAQEAAEVVHSHCDSDSLVGGTIGAVADGDPFRRYGLVALASFDTCEEVEADSCDRTGATALAAEAFAAFAAVFL
jgi:hypothetical protein